MSLLKWIVPALALVLGAWLAFDGTRGLIVGDYVTPASGPHAGQLGPWSQVVSAVGIDPRSTAVKVLHLALGIAWIVAAVLFFLRPSTGRTMLLICAVGSLWYLPFGTVVGVILIILLMLPQLRY